MIHPQRTIIVHFMYVVTNVMDKLTDIAVLSVWLKTNLKWSRKLVLLKNPQK